MFFILRVNGLNVSDITGTTFVLWKTNTAKRKEFCFIIRSVVRNVCMCSTVHAPEFIALYIPILSLECVERATTQCVTYVLFEKPTT